MRLFTHHLIKRNTAAARCCVIGCGDLADSDVEHIHVVSNDETSPPVRDLALRLPFCRTHEADYDRYLDETDDHEILPAGAFAELLTDIGETLCDEAPDALELIAPVVRDWLFAAFPAQAARAEAMLRGEDATAGVRQVAQ